MHYVENDQKPVVAASLDAEKAFDRIEWNYLFEVLQRMNIGSKYIGLIRLLYKCPVAQILTNGNVSSQFTLSHDTRQGCTASPLLFSLAVEPLTKALRSTDIHGVRIGGREHLVLLYDEDILLYLIKPELSLRNLVDILLGPFQDIK